MVQWAGQQDGIHHTRRGNTGEVERELGLWNKINWPTRETGQRGWIHVASMGFTSHVSHALPPTLAFISRIVRATALQAALFGLASSALRATPTERCGSAHVSDVRQECSLC